MQELKSAYQAGKEFFLSELRDDLEAHLLTLPRQDRREFTIGYADAARDELLLGVNREMKALPYHRQKGAMIALLMSWQRILEIYK